MKLLLHICCAPCSIYPIHVLQDESFFVMGYFYPHNIHPYNECIKRRQTLINYAAAINLKLILPKEYDIERFIRNIAFREKNRCQYCYHDRLRSTALLAKRSKFDAFSTTLLCSQFQQHNDIRTIGQSVSHAVGIRFYYQDFREGWQEAVETSKKLGMYRQQYCGCIYSEKERFFNNTHP